MKEYFEHAYEGFCNTIQSFIEFAELIGRIFLICLIYLTILLWAIPYKIYKEKKGDKTE